MRTEDIDRAFNAYNRFAVILAKHAGHKVSLKHLTRVAKRITRTCLKDIEGLDLDNIETKVSKMRNGKGEVKIIIRSDDAHEV